MSKHTTVPPSVPVCHSILWRPATWRWRRYKSCKRVAHRRGRNSFSRRQRRLLPLLAGSITCFFLRNPTPVPPAAAAKAPTAVQLADKPAQASASKDPHSRVFFLQARHGICCWGPHSSCASRQRKLQPLLPHPLLSHPSPSSWGVAAKKAPTTNCYHTSRCLKKCGSQFPVQPLISHPLYHTP